MRIDSAQDAASPSTSLWDGAWFRPVLYVLISLALLLSFGALRFGATFLILLALSYCFLAYRKRWSWKPAVLVCTLAIATLFSPIDVYGPLHGPISGPHRFRLVPLVMGLPKPATVEAARRGEVVLGGCFVDGMEPKYVLIW